MPEEACEWLASRASPAEAVAAVIALCVACVVAVATQGGEPGGSERVVRSSARELVVEVDKREAARSSGAAGARRGEATATILVHVAGRVARPGVHRLVAEARVADAVTAAGPLPDACLDALNLAARAVDGQKVYVPSRAEVVRTGGVRAWEGSGAGVAAIAGLPEGATAPAVDLNTATAEELERLPGIGEKTAARIVAYRQARGGFRSLEDLLDVPGIGERKLAQLRPYVRVGTP